MSGVVSSQQIHSYPPSNTFDFQDLWLNGRAALKQSSLQDPINQRLFEFHFDSFTLIPLLKDAGVEFQIEMNAGELRIRILPTSTTPLNRRARETLELTGMPFYFHLGVFESFLAVSVEFREGGGFLWARERSNDPVPFERIYFLGKYKSQESGEELLARLSQQKLKMAMQGSLYARALDHFAKKTSEALKQANPQQAIARVLAHPIIKEMERGTLTEATVRSFEGS